MNDTKFCSYAFISQTLAVVSLIVVSSIGHAQNPTSTPASTRIPYNAFTEIHVDESCHLLPNPALLPPGTKRPHLRRDDVICHLETIDSSQHIEESIAGNELKRNQVNITEQTYVLQNIKAEPVTFVVEQWVPDGWFVDSDPQPVETEKSIAVFRAQAQPGEIVRLHVGLRRIKPLKTRVLKNDPLAP